MKTGSGPAGRHGAADPAAALAERLFRDVIGTLELFTVYLGERLGLYRALASDGPATSSELAGRTGTTERYVREWLEHHAASGLLEVDDPAAGPLARRYRLPPALAPVLADPDDVRYRAFSGVEVARAGRWLPQLVEAFRTGDAPPPLPWAPEGRADYNRAVFLNLLGTRWLPPSRRWTGGCAASHLPGWLIWRAAPAGRPSRWRRPTPWPAWTVLTWTPT
jgi:hypothetical protein